jgi:predicted DsbA family dithiol-disulfide isomerase
VFSPITGGGSQFYCEDDLAEALHHHYLYGVRFREVAVPVEPEPQASSEEQPEADGLRQTTFNCNDDAKDYLADKFGVSRSKMRTRTNIEEVAKSCGLEIIWTD